MREFEIGDEIEWEDHPGQLYGKVEATSCDLLYGHFQGSYYKGEYGSIHKNNAIRRGRMFEVGERITAHNKNKLISGDIIREKDSGISWYVFERERDPNWFYGWDIFKVTTAKEVADIFFASARNAIMGNCFHRTYSYHDAGILPQNYNNHKSYYMGNVYDYQQKEATMSKYQELKERIENLQIGWNKEADDILRELKFSGKSYYIAVCTDTSLDVLDCDKNSLVNFRWSTQREKFEAFKKALLYLLDRSGIKEDKKEKKIEALATEIRSKEQQLRGLGIEIDSLKSQIKELRR